MNKSYKIYPSKGDLVKFTRGRHKGKIAAATSGVYVYRRLDAVDHEMISHGMGEYAGSFCSAFNVMFTDTGSSQRIICGSSVSYEIIEQEGIQSK